MANELRFCQQTTTKFDYKQSFFSSLLEGSTKTKPKQLKKLKIKTGKNEEKNFNETSIKTKNEVKQNQQKNKNGKINQTF